MLWSLNSLPVDDLPPRSRSSDHIATQTGDHDRARRAGMSISPASGILRWSVVCTGSWSPCQSVPLFLDPDRRRPWQAPAAAQDLTDQSGSQEQRTACLVSGATVPEPVLGLALRPSALARRNFRWISGQFVKAGNRDIRPAQRCCWHEGFPFFVHDSCLGASEKLE